MPTQESLHKYGQSLIFADATDFPTAGVGPPATAANDIRVGTPTAVQIDLTGVVAAAARQSDKTATLARTGDAWPPMWVLGACIENETAPAAGGTIEVWWNHSPNETTGTGNSGAATGADGAYAVGNEVQLELIGVMTVRNVVINIDKKIGTLWLPELYGSLIVINKTSTAFRSTATAMDETHITFMPAIDDLQAAAWLCLPNPNEPHPGKVASLALRQSPTLRVYGRAW